MWWRVEIRVQNLIRLPSLEYPFCQRKILRPWWRRPNTGLADQIEVGSFNWGREPFFSDYLNTANGTWIRFMDQNSAITELKLLPNFRNSTQLFLNETADRHRLIP